MGSSTGTVAVGSSIVVVVVDTVAANTATWVATEADTACWVVENVAIAVAVVVVVAHLGDVEAMPALDWEGTRLAAAPLVAAIVVVALADCPSSYPLDTKHRYKTKNINILSKYELRE